MEIIGFIVMLLFGGVMLIVPLLMLRMCFLFSGIVRAGELIYCLTLSAIGAVILYFAFAHAPIKIVSV